MKNEVRTVVAAAKMTTLEPLYEELENRGGEKKARERRTSDLDQLRCIKRQGWQSIGRRKTHKMKMTGKLP